MSIKQSIVNLKIGKLKEYKVFRETISSLDHIFFRTNERNLYYCFISSILYIEKQ